MSKTINKPDTPELERYVEYTYTNSKGKVIAVKRRFNLKTANNAK